MKELLYKSIYREIFYHADKKMIEMNYLPESSDYTDEEYKKDMLILCNFFNEKDVLIYYNNSLKFDYIIVPEMQDWLEETITPVLINSKIKKIGIITSKHVFTKVSVKQTMDKYSKNTFPFQTHNFVDEEAAMQWLFN